MENLEKKLTQFTMTLLIGTLTTLLLAIIMVYISVLGIVPPIVLLVGVFIGILLTLCLQGVSKMLGRQREEPVRYRQSKNKKSAQRKPKPKKRVPEYEEYDEYDEDNEDYENTDNSEYEDDEFEYDDDEEDETPPPPPAPKKKKPIKR